MGRVQHEAGYGGCESERGTEVRGVATAVLRESEFAAEAGGFFLPERVPARARGVGGHRVGQAQREDAEGVLRAHGVAEFGPVHRGASRGGRRVRGGGEVGGRGERTGAGRVRSARRPRALRRRPR